METVAVVRSEVAVDATDREIHFRQPPSGGIGLLPVDRDVAEMALAHTVGSETERAYRRGTALQKRRTLMQQWADYCASKV